MAQNTLSLYQKDFFFFKSSTGRLLQRSMQAVEPQLFRLRWCQLWAFTFIYSCLMRTTQKPECGHFLRLSTWSRHHINAQRTSYFLFLTSSLLRIDYTRGPLMVQKWALSESLDTECWRGPLQGRLSLCIHAKYPLGTGFVIGLS